jgi:hypothetical protein
MKVKAIRTVRRDSREAAECDVMVCMEWSEPPVFPDNRRASCAGCGHALQHRPDSPSQPMKLCIPCATGWAARQ